MAHVVFRDLPKKSPELQQKQRLEVVFLASANSALNSLRSIQTRRSDLGEKNMTNKQTMDLPLQNTAKPPGFAVQTKTAPNHRRPTSSFCWLQEVVMSSMGMIEWK